MNRTPAVVASAPPAAGMRPQRGMQRAAAAVYNVRRRPRVTPTFDEETHVTLPELVDSFTPEADPQRRHVQIMLCAAWTVNPYAGVSELVDLALLCAGRDANLDRDLCEQVALELWFARSGQVTA